MAEIRKYETGPGEGIGRLVREALGETIRPVTPGTTPPGEPVTSQDGQPEDPGVSSLPTTLPGGIQFNF